MCYFSFSCPVFDSSFHGFGVRNNLNVRVVVLCINGCMEYCVVPVKYAPKRVCHTSLESLQLTRQHFELNETTEPDLFTGVFYKVAMPIYDY